MTNVDEATMMSSEVLASAAEAIASALGLGDNTLPTDDWSVDEGQHVLGARLGGALGGVLLLAVNDDVATRLSSDLSQLQRGFERAVEAIVAAAGLGDEITVLDVGPMSAMPMLAVEIRDGDQRSALFGFSADDSADVADPVTPDAAGLAASLAASIPVFEPALMGANGHGVATPSSGPLTLLHDVEMEVTVELGRTTMPIRELLALQPGMVVEIDRAAGAPIDVLVNGRLIACGEVVVIDEEFGIRITEIVESGTHG